jgi:hypothetical protein
MDAGAPIHLGEKDFIHYSGNQSVFVEGPRIRADEFSVSFRLKNSYTIGF